MLISRAIEAYIVACRARRLSENTLNDYQNTFRKFTGYIGEERKISEIDKNLIIQFLASREGISKKTILNYHTGLSSLWGWAVVSGLCKENIIRGLPPPKPGKREIIPFTRDEFICMIHAAEAGNYANRDIAALFLLLDTGIRASEFCEIHMRTINLITRKIRVIGKGDKERLLIFSPRTKAAIEDYIKQRGYLNKRTDPLFLTSQGLPFKRNTLKLLIERLGNRGNVVNAHAHRFRHTFAIEFLRNGGNIFALQRLLGHTSLDMVNRYLSIVQGDIDRWYDRASPIMGWRL